MRQEFRFKQFSLQHCEATVKLTTDSVLLGAWAGCNNPQRILDVGTASGVIALMLAQRFNVMVDAIDSDLESVLLAQLNFRNSPWPHRLNAYHIAIENYKPAQKNCYDLIVCNPPFFVNSLKSQTASDQRAKHSAILSPLTVFRYILPLISARGFCSMIFPAGISNAVLQASASAGFFCTAVCDIFSSAEKKAHRKLCSFSLSYQPSVRSSLIIYNSNRQYTPDFIRLTSDFYLMD